MAEKKGSRYGRHLVGSSSTLEKTVGRLRGDLPETRTRANTSTFENWPCLAVVWRRDVRDGRSRRVLVNFGRDKLRTAIGLARRLEEYRPGNGGIDESTSSVTVLDDEDPIMADADVAKKRATGKILSVRFRRWLRGKHRITGSRSRIRSAAGRLLSKQKDRAEEKEKMY